MEQAGKINVYVCQKCGHKQITINAVDGTTPFMIDCRHLRGCGGSATSCFYPASAQSMRPQYEWYMPDAKELEALESKEAGWKDHCQRGGLRLRKVTIETLESFGFGLRQG